METTWLIGQKDPNFRLNIRFSSSHIYISLPPPIILVLFFQTTFTIKHTEVNQGKEEIILHTSKFFLLLVVCVCLNVWTHVGENPRENFTKLENTILTEDLLWNS